MTKLILSQRQAEALNLLSTGRSIADISLALGVSYSRAINLLNEILVKTGIKTRKELIVASKTLEFEVKE